MIICGKLLLLSIDMARYPGVFTYQKIYGNPMVSQWKSSSQMVGGLRICYFTQ